MARLRMLRLVGEQPMLSARVFEANFASAVADVVDCRQGTVGHLRNELVTAWLRTGKWSVVARSFESATKDYDIICPDYMGFAIAPLLVHLRNLSGARARFILFSHAPGATPLEWAMLSRMLRPGDRVVVPTESARALVFLLCPLLDPHVEVLAWPIPPPPPGPSSVRPRNTIVTLARLHSAKYLHRLVEAAALLGPPADGKRVRVEIGCELSVADTLRTSPYARSLMQKTERLGLRGRVVLVGGIDSPASKAGFLEGAQLLVNLSATVEESFGKSVAEALVSGVPVVATRWDGLPETVGRGGRCVPVEVTPHGCDVRAEEIAKAIAATLAAAPARELCQEEGERFRPARFASRLGRLVEAALDVPAAGAIAEPAPSHMSQTCAAPGCGLLAVAAPLMEFSLSELLEMQMGAVCASSLGGRADEMESPLGAAQLHRMLFEGLQPVLSRFMAGEFSAVEQTPARPPALSQVLGRSFWTRVVDAATGSGLPSTRVACVAALVQAGRLPDVEHCLEQIAGGTDSWVLDHAQIEILAHRGQFAAAYGLLVRGRERSGFGELEWLRLQTLGQLSRGWGMPGLALPWLRSWLTDFPDTPTSGALWVERSWCAALTSPPQSEEARACQVAARRLLGPTLGMATTDREALDSLLAGEPVGVQ